MLPAAAPAAMPGMVAGTTADTGATALAVRPVVADAVAVGVDVSAAPAAAVIGNATALRLAPLRRACAGRPRRAASRRERRLCRKTEPCQRERPGNRQRRPCSSQHLYHPLVSTGHPPLNTDTIQGARFLHGTTIFFSGAPPHETCVRAGSEAPGVRANPGPRCAKCGQSLDRNAQVRARSAGQAAPATDIEKCGAAPGR